MTAVPGRDAIPDRAFDRRDVAAAHVAGAIAAVAYGRTLAPGLTADADSPLFQFIGRVLGVAHNPGYPLYALLTWPVAQIPIGSLAWRINLFSAMTGAVAVALTTLAARSLGCGRIVAAAAALGFGLGATFWAQAVVAEVYTLNAALAGGALAGASAWARTGRPGLFYAALACVAAGLAHHTTIAAFVPALAALALVRDRRFALRARTIAASAAILACGLLPYALILVRSGDPQAYVESRATTIPDLARVVLGGQFRDRLLAEPWSRVLAERVPVLVERVLVADLTVAGLALAAIGTAWLAWRRTAEALALALAAGPIAAFAVAYAVVDTPVFLLPVQSRPAPCPDGSRGGTTRPSIAAPTTTPARSSACSTCCPIARRSSAPTSSPIGCCTTCCSAPTRPVAGTSASPRATPRRSARWPPAG
jgi:hypothetical protein